MPDMWDRLIEADKIEGPHAWIQWRGTNVCMDVHCSCGEHGHVDADFAYFYRCSCGKLWAVGRSLHLHALTLAEQSDVERIGNCIVSDEKGLDADGSEA